MLLHRRRLTPLFDVASRKNTSSGCSSNFKIIAAWSATVKIRIMKLTEDTLCVSSDQLATSRVTLEDQYVKCICYLDELGLRDLLVPPELTDRWNLETLLKSLTFFNVLQYCEVPLLGVFGSLAFELERTVATLQADRKVLSGRMIKG